MHARRAWANRCSDAHIERINALRRFIKAKSPEEEAVARAEREAAEQAYRRVLADKPPPRSELYRSIDSDARR